MRKPLLIVGSIIILVLCFVIPERKAEVTADKREFLQQLDQLVGQINGEVDEEKAKSKILIFNQRLRELDSWAEVKSWQSRCDWLEGWYAKDFGRGPEDYIVKAVRFCAGVKEKDANWIATYRTFKTILAGIEDSNFPIRQHLMNADRWYPSFSDLID